MLPYLSFSKLREYACRAKINLCITRKAHASVFASSSARPFELASLGACIVANPYLGVETWFEPGREIVVVQSAEEAIERYRWLLAIGALSLALLLSLPFMGRYVERFLDGLQGEDLATQMRLGEFKDSLTLIGRYPLLGVGFAGTPDRDIYLGVSSTYLKIGNATGITGIALFSLILLETLRYGLARWRRLRRTGLAALWLGFAAAVFGVAINGVVDHYYFNLEFHAVSLAFWLIVGLALATARATRCHDSQTSTQ